MGVSESSQSIPSNETDSSVLHFREDGYEFVFSGRHLNSEGRRHAPGGTGIFRSNKVNNGKLIEACNHFARLPIANPPNDETRRILGRMAERREELLLKNISKTNFAFPNFKLEDGVVNTDAIGQEMTDNWDAAVKQLKPFTNKSEYLYGPKLIDLVGLTRDPSDAAPALSILRRYYNLEAGARQRDIVLYRHSEAIVALHLFKNGRFDASNEQGNLGASLIWTDGSDADPVHEDRAKAYARDGNAPSFIDEPSLGYGMCRVMNDEFCQRWLQKYEFHDNDLDQSKHLDRYTYVPVTKWHIRYQLMAGLMDRYSVLNWLCEMAERLLENRG